MGFFDAARDLSPVTDPILLRENHHIEGSPQFARLSDPDGGCTSARNDQKSIFNLALGVCPLRGKGQEE